MEKSGQWGLSSAAFRDNLTFEASASTHVGSMNMLENRSPLFPWYNSGGSPSKEEARYSLHNKTLYDPGCRQAILRELSHGMSLAVSWQIETVNKYLLQGETIGVCCVCVNTYPVMIISSCLTSLDHKVVNRWSYCWQEIFLLYFFDVLHL